MPLARGVGLAANQLGVSARVAALGDSAVPAPGVDPELYRLQARVAFEPYVILNPVLHPIHSAGWSAWFEGCLSIPGYTGVVSRWNSVKVAGVSSRGEPLNYVAHGWHARILQHEVDHLDGRLYIDHSCDGTFMHKSEYASRWRGLPFDETLRLLDAEPLAPQSSQ